MNYIHIYPLLNFTPSLKLIYSTNHFLLSLFHTLMSFLWLSWPGLWFSISHSFSLYHPQPLHSPALRPILMYTVSGNKPPSIYYGWLCRHFKSPYSFHWFTSLLVHNLSLYLSFISSSCEAIIIVIIIIQRRLAKKSAWSHFRFAYISSLSWKHYEIGVRLL